MGEIDKGLSARPLVEVELGLHLGGLLLVLVLVVRHQHLLSVVVVVRSLLQVGQHLVGLLHLRRSDCTLSRSYVDRVLSWGDVPV